VENAEHTMMPVIPQFVFLFFLRFYLFDRGRERAQAGGVGEGEADSPLSKEPHVGLDPRTLGS